jgi:hypothetical protein
MDEIDNILTRDLTGVSLADPLLPKGDYEVEMVKIEQRRNKADTGNYLNIQVKTVAPVKSVEGAPIPAGRTLFGMLSLTATESYDEKAVERNLGRFQKAFDVSRLFPFEANYGKRGKCTVGISKPTADYPEERNEIKGWVWK